MSTPARKKLIRDFKKLQRDPPAVISGAPQDNNIMLWSAVIFGLEVVLSAPLFMYFFLYVSVCIAFRQIF